MKKTVKNILIIVAASISIIAQLCVVVWIQVHVHYYGIDTFTKDVLKKQEIKQRRAEGESAIEERAAKEREKEEALKNDPERFEKEMQAIANYLHTEGALLDVVESEKIDLTVTFRTSAKGWPYAVVYEEETEFDGVKGYKIQTITYDYMKDYEKQDEFVYEEDYYDDNGNQIKSTKILGFFLVERATLEVTDEHTTQWH